MARVNLPDGCRGFADGDDKFMASKGPGGYFVNLDESDPRDRRALAKLKNQDYASAGLVDAGPEKAFIRGSRTEGRYCIRHNRLWNSWNRICPKCGDETVLESEMDKSHTLADAWPEMRPILSEG